MHGGRSPSVQFAIEDTADLHADFTAGRWGATASQVVSPGVVHSSRWLPKMGHSSLGRSSQRMVSDVIPEAERFILFLDLAA
jgi:hypothetical protein